MKMKFTAALVALFLISGCVDTSVFRCHTPLTEEKHSSGDLIVAHVEAENGGVFLFNCIPVWSGSVVFPNKRRYDVFKDNIDEWGFRRLLDRSLRENGGERIEDVKFSVDERGAFTLWILWRRTIRGTGVAVKSPPAKKKTVTETDK